MLVVIQCAASKRSGAGHLRLNDGRRGMFVASPSCAPRGDGHVYAHPDGDSDRGTSWRDVLREYNEHDNPSTTTQARTTTRMAYYWSGNCTARPSTSSWQTVSGRTSSTSSRRDGG